MMHSLKNIKKMLSLCLYTDTIAKGKSLAQRYMPRNKICNFNKPNYISVRARIIRSLLPCAMWRHARWWTGEHTDVSEKSVFLTLYFEKGDDMFLQNSYAKRHGVTSQMTVIVIVIAKITLNFTSTEWYQKLRIRNTEKIFLYKYLVVKILFHIWLDPSVKKYRCPCYLYHEESSFTA